jgi:protoporphyrinogen oxidase
MNRKKAIIIGAGPAGLTAAYELLKRTNIQPIIFEKSSYMGGISRTVNYKGNRIDIGGHRFFSKSDRVMKWWQDILPLVSQDSDKDDSMLVGHRKSRIFFNRSFFDYPISLSFRLFKTLGLIKTFKMGVTYFWRVLFPFKKERNLEELYINHFGDELYKTFFKGYTKKVWGVECSSINADWGRQRVKGVSGWKTLVDFVMRFFRKKTVAQKSVEDSLITQFLYPKYGPGQMWETVARKIKELGGEIYTDHDVVGIDFQLDEIIGASVLSAGDTIERYACDYLFSTMPIKDLVNGLNGDVPETVKSLAVELPYRDFFTVGLLINKRLPLTDNWIYIQEPDVKMGRIQIFNNWSPFMVADEETTWMGLEYFCNDGDELALQTDEQLLALGCKELVRLGFVKEDEIIDGTVIRMEKSYPAYWGSYDRFEEIRTYLDSYKNLFLIGRNGMHRYNN